MQRAHDLQVIGLDGRTVGTPAGFRLATDASLSARNVAFQRLASTVHDRILIVHKGNRWYELHGAGLHALGATRVTLPGGTTLVAKGKRYANGSVGTTLTVHRNGKQLAALAPADVRDSSAGMLYTAKGTVLEPATGKLWRTRPGCVPAGRRAGHLLTLCPRTQARGPVELLAFARGGGHRRLSTVPAAAPYAVGGDLSPDGLRRQGACRGGERHGPFAPGSPLSSTPEGSLVSWVDPRADCEGRTQGGLYAIDPATLKRRLISHRFGPLWNPVPH